MKKIILAISLGACVCQPLQAVSLHKFWNQTINYCKKNRGIVILSALTAASLYFYLRPKSSKTEGKVEASDSSASQNIYYKVIALGQEPYYACSKADELNKTYNLDWKLDQIDFSDIMVKVYSKSDGDGLALPIKTLFPALKEWYKSNPSSKKFQLGAHTIDFCDINGNCMKQWVELLSRTKISYSLLDEKRLKLHGVETYSNWLVKKKLPKKRRKQPKR